MSVEPASPLPQPPAKRPPPRWGLFLGAVLLAVAGAVIAGEIRKRMGQPVAAPPEGTPAADATRHAVAVHKPDGPPGVPTGLTDAHGRPVTVGCATCHATKEPNPLARLGVDLKSFHQGLHGAHGNLACVSCHNPADGYAGLRLADGRSVPYSEVMQLCAQCHGPQYRDYLNGAHGGMAGHWDLTRGGRVRNNCIDCHDPHSPKYPTVRPVAGPRDRGSLQKGAGHE